MTANITIRPLSLDEARLLIRWAEAEGWNPCLDDAVPFHAADPEGFIGCFVDGAMVSGIAAVRYGEDFGFIGLYICHPGHRGQGHGQRVWKAAMSHLRGRVIGLDGVPEQQARYARMGFSHAYRTVRWSGLAPAGVIPQEHVREAADHHQQAIMLLDRSHFPSSRASFLTSWLDHPRICLVAERQGVLQGYAVLRDCVEGAKIGPLFAATDAIAEDLLMACISRRPGCAVAIDVPEQQLAFTEVLSGHGYQPGFTTARMYRGDAPSVLLEGIYGITTLELG